jgi:hypothetical protein
MGSCSIQLEITEEANMAYVGDESDEAEKDKPKSKLDEIIAAADAQRNKLATRHALSRAQQALDSEAKRIAIILGPLSARVLSQEIHNAGRMVEQMASSFGSNFRLEKELRHLRQAAITAGCSYRHDYAVGIPNHLLASQFSFRSEIEACIKAYESACANLLRDQRTLRESIQAIQMALDSAGIARDFFQDGHSQAVQTISERVFSTQGLMVESVRRVIEGQSDAFRTASLLAAQGLSKHLLENTQAIIDQGYLAFEAELIQKAIAPLVWEWGWLVCEAKLVSVDIEHDGDHFLYAEYDRETVIELLTARFALEETQPELSISSSGELEQPHDFLECSGEHDTHSAHYRGETVLDSEDKESKKKALIQCLAELRQKGIFDEETWDQIEIDARRAERFARGIFADVMHIAMLYTLELATLYVKENPMSAEEFRAHQEKAFARLRKLLPKPDEGRPKGTGLFRNEDDFLTALKDLLQEASSKPSQRQALHAIRQHPLCQKQTAAFPSQNETKTLRNWLDKCGMKYKDALEKYWKPAQKGK